MRRLVRYAALMAVVAIAAVGLGLVVVAPGESVVVRRFGRVLPDARGPGLHLGLPRGLDRLDRLRLEEVRRITVGLAETSGAEGDPGAGEYLTGDLNLIHARAVIQYRVADPVRFVVAAADRDATMTRLTESSLARALSRRDVDSTLRDGRAAIAIDVRDDLDRAARQYGLGLTILGVSLTNARPPVEVQADFAAAQAARSDRDRVMNEAAARAETVVIAARSRAESRLDRARADSDRVVAMAKGKAARFLAILAEAERSRRLTVRRIYLDAMSDLLPKVRRKILTPDEPVDLSLFGAEK